LPPELAAQLPALAGFAPPPPDPFGIPHDRAPEPPPLAMPAGNGATAGAPVAAAVAPLPEAKATLEVFDPAVDELAARYATRPRTPEEVRAFLVDLLVEKTGYPPETFEDDLDLEVDLGIDTVKQVEVMAAIRQAFRLTVDENFRMRDYTTIGAATDYIVRRLEADAAAPGSAPEAERAVPPDGEPGAAPSIAEAERDEQFTTL
jgi:acyl carrier protein